MTSEEHYREAENWVARAERELLATLGRADARRARDGGRLRFGRPGSRDPRDRPPRTGRGDPAMTLELGSRLTFTHSLARELVGTDPSRLPRKIWRARPAAWTVPGVTSLSGILVGTRTLANGEVEYGWEDNPTVFHAKEHFPAYLVAFDLRRAPVYVLPVHVTPEENDQ